MDEDKDYQCLRCGSALHQCWIELHKCWRPAGCPNCQHRDRREREEFFARPRDEDVVWGYE